MNKDIQTLIEGEKPIERWLIEKGFDNEVVSRGRQLPYIYASDAIMMYIQEVALSLFKWKKVWIEKPENKIRVNVKITSQGEFVAHLIERNGKMFWVSSYDKKEIECFDSDEWIPIPQID